MLLVPALPSTRRRAISSIQTIRLLVFVAILPKRSFPEVLSLLALRASHFTARGPRYRTLTAGEAGIVLGPRRTVRFWLGIRGFVDCGALETFDYVLPLERELVRGSVALGFQEAFVGAALEVDAKLIELRQITFEHL